MGSRVRAFTSGLMRNEETVAPIAVSMATTYTTEGPRNAA